MQNELVNLLILDFLKFFEHITVDENAFCCTYGTPKLTLCLLFVSPSIQKTTKTRNFF